MNEELIKTGVDELLDLLKGNSKIPLSDAAKKLNVSIDVAQAWVDFLVEENIVGIEYKFTTPYIYLNKPIETNISSYENTEKIDGITISNFKKEFWDKAKKNAIPDNKIDALWKNHLLQELDLKKKYFFFEAQRRGITKIEELWQTYQTQLLSQ